MTSKTPSKRTLNVAKAMNSSEAVDTRPRRVTSPQRKQLKRRPVALDGGLFDVPTVIANTARPPKVSLNSLVASLILGLVLAMSGFLEFVLPEPSAFFGFVFQDVTPTTLPTVVYNIQLPWALMMGGLLGAVSGPFGIVVYVVSGLFFFPMFANGGGLQYLAQPGAGYLLGLVLGAFACGRYIRWALREKDGLLHFLKLLGVTTACVLAVHLTGIVVMTVQMLMGQLSLGAVLHWAGVLTLRTFVYDVIVATALLALVRPLRAILWIVLY